MEGKLHLRVQNRIQGSKPAELLARRSARDDHDDVSAVRVPFGRSASRVAAAVPARGSVADRRDLDPAPPARGAAAAAPPEAELGGSGPARGTARRDTESPSPWAAASGHPGHDPALAPRHRPAPLGSTVHGRQGRGWPPAESQGPGNPAGPGEPRMGLPPDPRGTGGPGSASPGVDGVGELEGCQMRLRRGGPDRPGRGSYPGRRDPGIRLLHRRPAQRQPGLCPGRHRARDPAHPHPRRHPAPHRGMDHASRHATCSWTSASKHSESSS